MRRDKSWTFFHMIYLILCEFSAYSGILLLFVLLDIPSLMPDKFYWCSSPVSSCLGLVLIIPNTPPTSQNFPWKSSLLFLRLAVVNCSITIIVKYGLLNFCTLMDRETVSVYDFTVFIGFYSDFICCSPGHQCLIQLSLSLVKLFLICKRTN